MTELDPKDCALTSDSTLRGCKSEIESQLHLATLFDRGYASRASVMLASSQVRLPGSLNVLALDNFVSRLPPLDCRISITTKNELYLYQPGLLEALVGRSEAEAIFTMGPTYLSYLLNSIPDKEWLVYADADLEFHAPLSDCMHGIPEGTSVLIAPHRHYWWNRKRLAKFGEFNVGLVAFRNDPQGRLVLKTWAEACLEWCRDRPEDGKYADQKYLESFSSWSAGVSVDGRVGSNLAPWNASHKRIRREKDGVTVNGERLLYFHMQGLRRKTSGWQLGHLQYLSLAGRRLKREVYLPYLAKLEAASESLGEGWVSTSARSSGRLVARMAQRILGGLQLVLGQTISIKRIERFLESNPSK